MKAIDITAIEITGPEMLELMSKAIEDIKSTSKYCVTSGATALVWLYPDRNNFRIEWVSTGSILPEGYTFKVDFPQT